MPASRLPRFSRASEIAPIEITARDRNILQLVHHHRFLRSSHLVSLMPGSSQQLLRRLQLLYHHGYLERPRVQLDYYHNGGSRYMVYGIGNKGAALLKREVGEPFTHLRWGEKNRSVGRVYLDHALLVSDVMVGIELACRQNGRIRLISQHQLLETRLNREEPLIFRWNVNVNNNLRLGIVPDRVFALEYELEGGQTDRAFFFLEADRGTMPVTRSNLSQTSFYRKLLAYEATWLQSIHRRLFGFHRFRVLTVTTGSARLQALVEACSRLKSGHGLFLFADRTILEKPGTLLSSAWQSAKQAGSTSLLD